MTQPKPNTMDDLDEILEDLGESYYPMHEYPDQPIYTDSNKEAIAEAKALITAKLQEVDRAAREDELDLLVKAVAARKQRETWSDWSWRVTHYLQDRLAELRASLKGGDDDN